MTDRQLVNTGLDMLEQLDDVPQNWAKAMRSMVLMSSMSFRTHVEQMPNGEQGVVVLNNNNTPIAIFFGIDSSNESERFIQQLTSTLISIKSKFAAREQ